MIKACWLSDQSSKVSLESRTSPERSHPYLGPLPTFLTHFIPILSYRFAKPPFAVVKIPKNQNVGRPEAVLTLTHHKNTFNYENY